MAMKKACEDKQQMINDLQAKLLKAENECQQLKNLIEALPGDIYWKDINGIWLGVNSRGEHTLKRMGFIHSSEDVIGKTDYDLFGEETANNYRKNDLEVIEKKIEIAHEEIIEMPDGKIMIQLSTKRPIWNKEGKITGIVGNTIDITYLKNIERELKKAKEAADAANIAKDEFLANMSHDIRTPLTGIIGISAMLEKEVQKHEEKEHAHWVNVSGEQLLSLLNSVLDIVSIGGRQEKSIKMESVDIHQLITNIAELELPTIKLKNLELKVEVADSVPGFIKTDGVKLHRILLNLLGNAIKFTDKGCVSILVSFQKNNARQGLLELAVSDTGPGIAKEDQDKVFDRFYRANPSYKGKYTGFGVGLHIVQEYVSMLNGIIRLESQQGQGTTFKVTLPVKIDTRKDALSSHRLNHSPDSQGFENNILSKEKSPVSDQLHDNSPLILVVEDNPIALKVAESIVKQAHCRYLLATTGEQALDLMNSHSFDILLSDIGLPGISGHELAVSIRRQEKLHNKKPIPIIGLTAHAARSVEQESLQSGMNRVITKPISLTVLREILAQYGRQKTSSTRDRTPTSDLPDSDAELFNLGHFPLLDIEAGTATVGGVDTLKELISFMLDHELPEDMTAINKAHDEKNWEAVEKLAHKMKSSALYCGITRMKFACQYLERYQKSGQTQLQNKLYQQLMDIIEQTTVAIRQWLGSFHNKPEETDGI